MPEYVFGDNQMNYLVPNEAGNTAINDPDVNFKDVAVALIDIYRKHLKNYKYENFWGQPEDLVKILDEGTIKSLLGETHSSERKIAGGVQVRQSVLNLGEYACHMINLLNLLSRQNLLEINYNQRVDKIDISEKFKLNINGSHQHCFDTVINAGYATGLAIPIPAPRNEQYREGNLVKLKVYGLYKIPLALKQQIPALNKNLSSIILIRGQYGGIIKVGSDLLAVFSGREYNQGELHFPIDTDSVNIPQDWLENLEKITGRTEEEVSQSIKHDLAKWIPWAKELEDIKLKKAVQVYPSRKPANELEAAQRNDNPVRYIYQHKNGGKYIHIPGFKLTSIPYQSFQVVLEILSIYIHQGILTQEQVEQHIMLDSNNCIILSSEMEYALGKDLEQLAISEREKILQEWDIY
ncbi:MAG: hypothetical protein F6K47_33330 [Symploca sp. SIO2E6]|nr:hypothetical protein [Symploca sp. SIO2E6]